MKNNLPNIKERVLFLAENVEVSKQKFFKNIKITYGNFTGEKKKRPLNSDAIENILLSYPETNPEWLLTGKGEMLKDNQVIGTVIQNRKTTDRVIESQEVPLYDFEATAGLKELFNRNPPQNILDTIKIPNLPKCDGAVSVTGDSMYPLLKSGDLILYKQIPTDYNNLFFGEIYLIGVRIDEWEEYITVKYIQKSDKGNEYISLVSQNQHHQSKDIKFSQITALAMVKASIRYNTMF